MPTLPTVTSYQFFSYPAESAGTSPTPTPSTGPYLTGGINPGGNTVAYSVDDYGDQNVNIVASVLPDGAATSAYQVQVSDQLPNNLGPQARSESFSVTLASDHPIIPVSGTLIATQATGTNLHTVVDSGNVTLTGTSPVSVTTLPLPAGAATSALQTTLSGQLPTTLGVKTSVNSLSVALASDQVALPTLATYGRTPAQAPLYNVYTTTPITASSFTQLVASTAQTINYLDIFDSSGQAMILAEGVAGSEVPVAYIPPGGDQIPLRIPSGTRLSYKGLTADAVAGYLLFNAYT